MSGCTRSEPSCELAEELRLDITHPTHDTITTLGPGQRHAEFELEVSVNGNFGVRAYELWLGDTWAGECGGAATWRTTYAIVTPTE